MSLVRLATGTRGWLGEPAVTDSEGTAIAALSWTGQGSTVFVGICVVVVVEPGSVVVGVPGAVEVVDEVLDVVVVELVPVAVVTSSRGKATARAIEQRVRAATRSAGRRGFFIDHEVNGSVRDASLPLGDYVPARGVIQ
jgi:hypothetical protein